MRRIACLAFPELRLELAREKENFLDPKLRPSKELGSPLVVIVSSPKQSAREISSFTRIDTVSAQARKHGVSAGQTIAAARAKCSDLCVRIVSEDAIRAALVRVAEAVLSFGPASSFCTKRGVVWIEIDGCAHLYGSEHTLATTLKDFIRTFGYECNLAIADGPRLAAAVARFSSLSRDGIAIVPEGQGAAAIAVLPTSALELDDGLLGWFSSLGLDTCASLQKLPRSSLGMRLGRHANDVFALLDGEDRAPLEVWRVPDLFEESLELEWGVTSGEVLVFLLKTLCDRLAMRLQARGYAASKLEIRLKLDRALCHDKKAIASFAVALPVGVTSPSDLLAVVRPRLEREALPAPVLVAMLRVLEVTPVTSCTTRSLFIPEPKADATLAPLVAELTAELGETGVGILSLVDTWNPHGRTRLVPFGTPSISQPSVSSALEPSRLFPPIRVSRDSFTGLELLGSIQTVEWWRGGVEDCDMVAAWLEGANVSGGMLARLCLSKESDAAHLCGWID